MGESPVLGYLHDFCFLHTSNISSTDGSYGNYTTTSYGAQGMGGGGGFMPGEMNSPAGGKVSMDIYKDSMIHVISLYGSPQLG
jgi:hypothetical protein